MSEPRIPKRGGRRAFAWFVFVVLLGLVMLAAAVSAWWVSSLRPVDLRASAVVPFRVEPGWGATQVSTALEEAGLVRDARALTLFLRIEGLDRSIGEGRYELAPSMDVATIAARLGEGGAADALTLTIPEGWRALQVAERIADLGLAEASEARSLIEAPGALAPEGLPEGSTLEGYLLPDTYELLVDSDAAAALSRPIEAMQAALVDGLAERASEEGLTTHALLTLASIVQAEAAGPEEMPVIAGVFRNRLDIDMPLQSDPTVAYGLGKTLPELSRPAGDFEVDHAWNTYTRPGLPVGPIGNPSLEALTAVLEPERLREDGTPWLYFLHGVDDGVPVFRPNVNLSDHLRDVNAYLR